MNDNRLNYDVDGDGVNDSHLEEFDTNHDGMVDFGTLDIDGDGVSDRLYYDTDGDGAYDHIESDEDGDGYFERQEYDTNGDGISDIGFFDNDRDGVAERKYIDSDFDGKYDIGKFDEDKDGLYEKECFDTDADGMFDQEIKDSDGDGLFDTVTYNIDTDGDGVFDAQMREIYEDIDGDGEFDKVTIMGRDDLSEKFEVLEIRDLETDDIINDAPNKDELVEINPVFYDENDNGVNSFNYPNFDPDSADMDNVVGDPGKSMEYWEHQGNTGRCALYAQMFIIEELTGQDIDIEEFADIAEENGWFSESGGTTTNNLDKMLKYYGLETEVSTGNDLTDLAEALNNGDKVIVGVDADEYWYSENDGTYTPGDTPNHAIEVIGIDYSDPDNPMVIINDSGSPDGCGDMIPYQAFMDAWEDSDFRMIVVDADAE